MADAAAKLVQSQLLDTWTRGPSIFAMLNLLGFVGKGGDSLDLPEDGDPTVNTSETASVEASAITVETLTVNRPKFINRGITQAQLAQLLNGNKQYANQLARSHGGALRNAIDRDLTLHAIAQAGSGFDASNHFNVAGDAVQDSDVNECEAAMLSQDGVLDEDLIWLVAPAAAGGLKSVAEYIPSLPTVSQGVLGVPTPKTLNGISMFRHNAVPGANLNTRLAAVATANTVTTNVATATGIAAGHGFVPGQLVYTVTFTNNVAIGTPAAVTSVTSTTITYPLVTGDGAQGPGTIYSASGYAMLLDTSRCYVGADTMIPFNEMVKREGAAGWAHQMFSHIGRNFRVDNAAGESAIKILHTPD